MTKKGGFHFFLNTQTLSYTQRHDLLEKEIVGFHFFPIFITTNFANGILTIPSDILDILSITSIWKHKK